MFTSWSPTPPRGTARPYSRYDSVGHISCPTTYLLGSTDRYYQGFDERTMLPTSLLQYDVQCHAGQAFVDMLLVCQYHPRLPKSECVFLLPKTADTTITEVTIRYMEKSSMRATMVVHTDDYEEATGNAAYYYAFKEDNGSLDLFGPASQTPEAFERRTEFAEFNARANPECFELPITNAAPGDRYEIHVKYSQPMCFEGATGRCFLELPTRMPQDCLPPGVDAKSVLEATVTFDTVMSMRVSMNYPFNRTDCQEPGTVTIKLDNSTDNEWPVSNLLVECSIWRDSVTAVLQVQPPQTAPKAGGVGSTLGTFGLSIMPPGPEESVCFPRDVVFVWDCSQSMKGEPMKAANAALVTGLATLKPTDRFGIVAFNHEQQWWLDRLVHATPDITQACKQWVEDCVRPHGGTDIGTPLFQALQMLQTAPLQMGEARLPIIFLLTDGCVDNERDIYKMATNMLQGSTDCLSFARDADHESDSLPTATQQHSRQAAAPQVTRTSQQTGTATDMACPGSGGDVARGTMGEIKRLPPRIFTFGIGPFCNHYFLKRLAAVGRGRSSLALRTHTIRSSLEQLLQAAAQPILADLHMELLGAAELARLQFFPDPLPDVYVGQPLVVVSGSYVGPWGRDARLTGLLPSGRFSSDLKGVVLRAPGGHLLLDSIHAKSQLEQLVAEAWLQGKPQHLVDEICYLSLRHSIPVAPFTVAVELSTTPQQVVELKVPEQRTKQLMTQRCAAQCTCRCQLGGILLVAGVTTAATFGSPENTADGYPVDAAMRPELDCTLSGSAAVGAAWIEDRCPCVYDWCSCF